MQDEIAQTLGRLLPDSVVRIQCGAPFPASIREDMTLDEYIVAFRDAILAHMRADLPQSRSTASSLSSRQLDGPAGGQGREMVRLKENVDTIVSHLGEFSQPEDASSASSSSDDENARIVPECDSDAIKAWRDYEETHARFLDEVAQELRGLASICRM